LGSYCVAHDLTTSGFGGSPASWVW
jgi:hypothetical protein